VEGEPAEQARAGGLGPGVDVAGVEQIVGAGPDLGEPIRAAGGQRRGRAAGEHERVVGAFHVVRGAGRASNAAANAGASIPVVRLTRVDAGDERARFIGFGSGPGNLYVDYRGDR